VPSCSATDHEQRELVEFAVQSTFAPGRQCSGIAYSVKPVVELQEPGSVVWANDLDVAKLKLFAALNDLSKLRLDVRKQAGVDTVGLCRLVEDVAEPE